MSSRLEPHEICSAGWRRGLWFHTARWEAAFLACCADNDIEAPPTLVSPLSPDPEHLAERTASPRCAAAAERLDALIGNRQMVLSVDRVEPSKNLLRGFWSFDELLHRHPELRGKVVLLSLTYPRARTFPSTLPTARSSSTPRSGSTKHGERTTGLRCCSTSPMTSTGPSPPSCATTCCLSTRFATGSISWPRRARCSTRTTGC